MNISKRVFLITMFALSFFVSSQANAIFHDEYWGYYFKNQNTHEIKQTRLDWDMWNGFFDETQNKKLTPERIPQKNYFENWDLIGYYHNNRYTNIQCKWNDGTIIISNLDKNHFGDNG